MAAKYFADGERSVQRPAVSAANLAGRKPVDNVFQVCRTGYYDSASGSYENINKRTQDAESPLTVVNPSFTSDFSSALRSSPSVSATGESHLNQVSDIGLFQASSDVSSSSHDLYVSHSRCEKQCKQHMFHAIMHFSDTDVTLAQEIREKLERRTVAYLGQEYPVRIAFLTRLTPKIPVEALQEVAEYEMAKLFIILRTANYEVDSDKKAIGNKIMNKGSFDVIQIWCGKVTQRSSSSSFMTRNVQYSQQSTDFLNEMRSILSHSVQPLIEFDNIRHRCEESRKTNPSGRKSKLKSSARYSDRSEKTPAHKKEKSLTHEKKISSSDNSSSRGSLGQRHNLATTLELCAMHYRWSESSSSDQKTNSPTTSSSGHQADVSSTDEGSLAQPNKLFADELSGPNRYGIAPGNRLSHERDQSTCGTSMNPTTVTDAKQNETRPTGQASNAPPATSGEESSSGSNFLPFARENKSEATSSGSNLIGDDSEEHPKRTISHICRSRPEPRFIYSSNSSATSSNQESGAISNNRKIKSTHEKAYIEHQSHGEFLCNDSNTPPTSSQMPFSTQERSGMPVQVTPSITESMRNSPLLRSDGETRAQGITRVIQQLVAVVSPSRTGVDSEADIDDSQTFPKTLARGSNAREVSGSDADNDDSQTVPKTLAPVANDSPVVAVSDASQTTPRTSVMQETRSPHSPRASSVSGSCLQQDTNEHPGVAQVSGSREDAPLVVPSADMEGHNYDTSDSLAVSVSDVRVDTPDNDNSGQPPPAQAVMRTNTSTPTERCSSDAGNAGRPDSGNQHRDRHRRGSRFSRLRRRINAIFSCTSSRSSQ